MATLWWEAINVYILRNFDPLEKTRNLLRPVKSDLWVPFTLQQGCVQKLPSIPHPFVFYGKNNEKRVKPVGYAVFFFCVCVLSHSLVLV